MDMSETIIKIENVSKQYRLGAIGGGTLKGDLQSFMARIRGKEDPNSKIGAAVYAKNEKFLALQDINLEIKKGEAVGIIGHNGAGKSTLLKLLTRVTAPTTGQICMNGRVASMLEVGTGFHPELTGRENVYLNGAILGMTKAEITEKFDEIVEFSEVKQFIDTPVKRYSSGMYVKLAFSVAAHLDSEIMIMDEVLAVGDVKFQQKCLDKMSEAAHKDGRTVLYVSHNMNTIRRLCDRCILLDHGKVVFDGDVDEAISLYLNISNEMHLEYDYTTRTETLGTGDIKMLGLSILNKTNCTYEKGEDIEFSLRCISKKSVKNARFRFEISYNDGEVIGTAFSDEKITVEENKTFECTFSLNTKLFPEGKYYAVALIFEYDSSGNELPVDWVEPAFSFEVKEIQTDDKIKWLHRYWGHIHLEDAKLQSIK